MSKLIDAVFDASKVIIVEPRKPINHFK